MVSSSVRLANRVGCRFPRAPPSSLRAGWRVASEVDLVRARRQHALLEAGEEPLEVAPPARQERVHVTALRHAGTIERPAG